MHLPASDIEQTPSLLKAAKDAGIRVTLYADRSDVQLARLVRQMSESDKQILDALVIDGPRGAFCRDLMGM